LVQAPCSGCHRKTWLHSVRRIVEEDSWVEYRMIECAGCKAVSLEQSGRWSDNPGGNPDWHVYYPSPATRRPPSWRVPTKLLAPATASRPRG